MFFWMMSITIGVAVMAISVGASGLEPMMINVHMLVAALIAIVFALISFRDTRAMVAQGASRAQVNAGLLRFMGLVWAWGALAISIIYGTNILHWSPWWAFFLTFMVLAGLCLFLALTIQKDAEAGNNDARLLKVGDVVAGLTIFAMIVVAGIIGFGRLKGLTNIDDQAWAANHVFLFDALALSAISALILKSSAGQRLELERPTTA